MVEALELAAGHRVLELAAGVGDVGFRALRLIVPGGTLICSDQSQAMVDVARAHARELGLDSDAIEFRVLDGEWIDLEVASVDRVLCRWGYMLMADPAAAMRETRRVLRSGGLLSLAVWDRRTANPWSEIPGGVLIEHGLMERPVLGTPGPFALGDERDLRGVLEEAGFGDIEIGAIDIERRAADFAHWWATALDLSVATRTALENVDPEKVRAIEDEIASRFAPFTDADGALAVPGRTLVARAEA